MAIWIILSGSIAAEEPPPQREPDAPLPSGTMLRAMMADAGFDVLTPKPQNRAMPLPPTEGPAHAVMPPGSGGRVAPGFALRLALPPGAEAPEVSVSDVDFVPRDDGVAPDAEAGDGVWTVMIERYPPDHPLSIRCGGQACFDGEIVLQQTRDVPQMVLDLTR